MFDNYKLSAIETVKTLCQFLHEKFYTFSTNSPKKISKAPQANLPHREIHEIINAFYPHQNSTYAELINTIRELTTLILQSDVYYGNIFVKQLLPRLQKHPLIFPVPGGKIKLSFNFRRDLQTIINGGWELKNINLMRRLIRSKDVIFDIGAHIGHFTIFAASLIDKYGKVFAFEPAPSNFMFLNENLIYNNFDNSVKAFPIAVSDMTGKIDFYQDGNTGGTEYSMFPNRHGKHGISFSVETMPLDHFSEKQNITSVNFIKIDTEGSELKILYGAKKILYNNPNIFLLIELHPWVVKPIQICSFLNEYKMNFYDINRNCEQFTYPIFRKKTDKTELKQ